MRDLETRQMDLDDVREQVKDAQRTHRATIAAFHRMYYAQPFTWGMTLYDGIPLLKTPNDLWSYQEIIRDTQPTLIVETGTAFGGSALYFAHQLDRNGAGAVVSIDIEPHPNLPRHPRVTFFRGSSVAEPALEYVRRRAEDQRVMVILDSDHGKDHVLRELELYAPLVTLGCFCVVEDTNLCGRPLAIDWKGGPGPGEAVDVFLDRYPTFVADPLAERHLLTMFPGGWLRRVA